jgi:hypothetical protein
MLNKERNRYMNLTRREIIVFVVVVLVVLVGGFLFVNWFGSLRGIAFGGVGPGMMGPGRMMGGYNTFGWLLPCLIPLVLLILIIVGLVWLLSSVVPAAYEATQSSEPEKEDRV